MSSSYTPELSGYKEGTVISVDSRSAMVKIRIHPQYVNTVPIIQAGWGKFEVDMGEDGEYLVESMSAPSDTTELHVSALVQARVIY
ncbi:hypothetical protein BC829DRAFT_231733 [Chytridium lagenaria]|nr:hypothetical protein BC829DRAFT_231733 [Chytridium lagenaria]